MLLLLSLWNLSNLVGGVMTPPYRMIEPDTNCLHDFHKMDLHFLCKCGIISVLALEDAEC